MNAATVSSPTQNASPYGFHCDLDEKDFGRGATRITEALKSEGFGVLTEIDVQTTMQEVRERLQRVRASLIATRTPAARPDVRG